MNPTWQTPDGAIQLYRADCLEILPQLEPGSVDAVVTDPPAGIGFMGKNWDHHKGGRKEWCAWLESIMAECLRVLKPGGHALVWALPRTSHWTATACEDAGFQIRDCIYHAFGSGFPKSCDVSKQLDKAAGEKRPVHRGVRSCVVGVAMAQDEWSKENKDSVIDGTPITDAARQWQGWGTALKPAVECWWLLRKPLEGTVAANVLQHGTGALNIDGCRIEGSGAYTNHTAKVGNEPGWNGQFTGERTENIGRWPANLIHDGSEEVLAGFPEAVTSKRNPATCGGDMGNNIYGRFGSRKYNNTHNDSGSAARFFYCAKASKEDRDEGCEGLEARTWQEQGYRDNESSHLSTRAGAGRTSFSRNHHPTVKPTDLMRYLCRLITPPGGIVLDPFMGSGSTGKACIKENFRFVGIELEAEYFAIAQTRIEAELSNFPLLEPPPPKQTELLEALA